MKMTILVVDDEPRILSSLAALFDGQGHTTYTFSSGEECTAFLSKQTADVIFLDVVLPGMDGLETLVRIRDLASGARVMMMSGQADLAQAVKAAKLGAVNFFEKPLNPDHILLSLDAIGEQIALERKAALLEKELDLENAIIGDSPVMKQLLEGIAKAAPSDGRVLITGEMGTGKELVARAIHRRSGRKGLFVSLNCAALPGTLVESELFGYEKGAFTGALRPKPGRFETADGGTLFLDEIGDMGLDTQAKLLRVLEENEAVRLGGSAPYKFHVRIIAATNKDLSEEIRQRRFREDLFYRLNVIPLECPPLRERWSDIPMLARYYLARICGGTGRGMKDWGEGALDLFSAYSWPGNVRELRNAVERLVIMAEGRMIEAEEVRSVLYGRPVTAYGGPEGRETLLDVLPGGAVRPDSAHQAGVEGTASRPDGAILQPEGKVHETSGEDPWLTEGAASFRERVEQYEKRILSSGFAQTGGNVSLLARMLKMDRSNLHRKLKQYGIK